MLNNPQTYPSPLQFNPERFLSNDEKKAETDHRSICPGILNSQEAPINILMLLVFDI